jgi:hypothetical protein
LDQEHDAVDETKEDNFDIVKEEDNFDVEKEVDNFDIESLKVLGEEADFSDCSIYSY